MWMDLGWHGKWAFLERLKAQRIIWGFIELFTGLNSEGSFEVVMANGLSIQD